MLRQLRSRLHAANLDVHFTIVTSEPADDDTLLALTRASAGIPLVSFETLPESFALRSGWNRYSNDVMVVDSCGRVTYQVVMPWSSLQYPYVKAAVISTLKDQPCGACNATEKQPKVAESHALNSTLHEMKESRNKTQSKLVSIVNQYKPLSPIKEITKNNENVGESVSGVRAVLDTVTETNENHTEASLNQDEQTRLTEIPNTTDKVSQSNVEDAHSTPNKDGTGTKETTEKTSKGKRKLKGKKHRSKTTRKQARDEEITEEQSQISPISDAEQEKALYTSVENPISHEVTLAPLRETDDGLIPIRVIMRSPHEHDGKNFDYLEMQLGNPGYHGHLEKTDSERELEEERKELQLVEDDFDTIGAEDKMFLEEEQNNGDALISGVAHRNGSAGKHGDSNREIDDGEKKEVPLGKDLMLKSAGGSVIDAVKVDKLPSPSEAIVDNKDEEEAIDVASKPDGTDKSKNAKKKNKKTEKGNKKVKGNKTKLTNLPEQDWMNAESKDVPDKFDDVYPQVNDFANDVREEELDHENGEKILGDLTVTDLKHLIEEMGLEVDGNEKPVKNDSVIFESANNKTESDNSNVDIDKGGKKEHHKSVNTLIVAEKADKVKDLKEKETVAKNKNSDEIVTKSKVTLVPSLSDGDSEAASTSGSSSKEVMEHYSKLLPWIDYHL